LAVNYADFEYLLAKKNVVDKARVLFSNTLDTSKGLQALYELPETVSISADTKLYKNPYMIKLDNSAGSDRLIYQITNGDVTKFYINCNVATDGAIGITLGNSDFSNYIGFIIYLPASAGDFRVNVCKEGTVTTKYTEGVDLNAGQYYNIELIVDFENNSFTVFRDNEFKAISDLESLSNAGIRYLQVTKGTDEGSYEIMQFPLIVSWEEV